MESFLYYSSQRLPCGFQHDTEIDRQISALSDIHTVTTSRQHKDIWNSNNFSADITGITLMSPVLCFSQEKRQTHRKVIDMLLYLWHQISKLRTFTGQIVRLTVSRRTKLTFKNVNTCHIEKITFGKSNKLVSSISFIILGTI